MDQRKPLKKTTIKVLILVFCHPCKAFQSLLPSFQFDSSVSYLMSSFMSHLPPYVKSEQLTQPASLAMQAGQRLTITCQVSFSVSTYRTNWIRQPVGKGLEWIGSAHIGYPTFYKDSLKNRFSMTLQDSSKTMTLNGQNMQPEDSAVYYCARYDHSDTNKQQS
uniref:Ig-like domain-containing protein n=1 Tax=Xiphophorus couchianus TaxID=32473 RepID=A0A3B5MTC5_9TELE